MGSSTRYGCDSCGYDSGTVLIGWGMRMIERVPVACSTCRAVCTIERPAPLDPPSHNDAGERLRGACPSCHGSVVVLPGEGREGPGEPLGCPACGAPSLVQRPTDGIILWD